MISISDTAQAHFRKLLEKQPDGTNIRVFVVNPGTQNAECSVSYCPPDAVDPEDQHLPFSGFDCLVDPSERPLPGGCHHRLRHRIRWAPSSP